MNYTRTGAECLFKALLCVLFSPLLMIWAVCAGVGWIVVKVTGHHHPKEERHPHWRRVY